CKDEHVDNDWPGVSLSQPRHGHRWMNILRKERGQYPLIDVAYQPTPCMHCENAPCIRAARDGAVYRRKDGIVIIDPQKAKGQEHLVKACPYGAIWWNEEKQIPQKCTLCAHLLDQGWKTPRCVQACPTGALRVVFCDESEMNKMVEQEGLEVLRPELKTRPAVYYKNLYRFTRCFVGGSVAVEKGGVTDCVKGAVATLRNASGKVGEATTDTFGDFKIDRLEEGSGKYTLEILHPEHGKKELEVTVETSVNVGTLLLSAEG
ncbi:MAG: oxidoreductase, partial [Deltaproteobacteria bacterium]|nr:oxidoreductase [Deltaproteobacteria bacterium]